ncbi:hypothetical protein [Amycolatopsis pigmentata]|uniref:Uncharacterized protein n=1 Tax=Amycolatopsis pigmentata TaxID=450801 RepID=A0ABW5G1M0_9PSEU
MSARYLSPRERRSTAQRAIDALGTDRRNHVLLRVRCSASHHVGTVYRTDVGPVFASIVGPRPHGSRDFVDEAHGPRGRGREYVDLLEGGRHADDQVPAYCECGAHFLSRSELLHALAAAERTVQIQ